MNDLLEYISTWSVLKWIVLVLIAGFIGQFGRMAAEAIAKKIQADRNKADDDKEEMASDFSKERPVLPQPAAAPTNDVPDKKMLKALAKAKKKEAKKKT